MATHSKNAASSREIEDWVGRIEEITGALDTFLKSDPQEEEKRKTERTAARKVAADEAAMLKVRERYDAKRYKKFEDDSWIAEMLAACDKPPVPAHKKHNDLTAFEQVALREAEDGKKKGNTAIVAQRYQEAHDWYSNAIGLGPCDDELLIALHNNRAQACISLALWEQCIEDASFVLSHQRHNAKALLRRATALSALYRPREASEDLRRLLIAEPKNVEGLKLKARVAEELEEYETLESFKTEERAKQQNKNSEENNAERIVDLSATLVGYVSELSRTLLQANADANEEENNNNASHSPPSSSTRISKSQKANTESSKDLAATLQPIVDVLCEVGGILALHPGSALLFRSQIGLAATFDILSLLLVTSSTSGRSRSTEFLLAQPMSIVCLTCAYKVLGLSFPSVAARKYLATVILGRPNGPSKLLTRLINSAQVAEPELEVPVEQATALAASVAFLGAADPSFEATSPALCRHAPWVQNKSLMTNLAAYPPLHAAAAEFLVAAASEESGVVLGLVLGGAEPVSTVASLASVIGSVSSSVKQQRRRQGQPAPSNLAATVSPVPTLTALLHLAHRLLTHSGTIALNGGDDLQRPLVLLEAKNLVRTCIISSCLTALETIDEGHGQGSSPATTVAQQQQRLHEAALEVLLVVPSRCYYTKGGAGVAADDALVKEVLKHILPSTLGTFVTTATNWAKASPSDSSSAAMQQRLLTGLSYKAEAALAIAYNAIIQSSPTTSSTNGTLSDRARLLTILKDKTRLFTYIMGLMAVVAPADPSGPSSRSKQVVASELLSNQLNVIARALAVLDRAAGTLEELAVEMRGHESIVMSALWEIAEQVDGFRARDAASKKAGQPVPTAAVLSRIRYTANTLEHVSILIATLYHAKSPEDFHKQFSGEHLTQCHLVSQSGEGRLRLLIRLLEFSGGFRSASGSAGEVIGFESNAVFLGNIALLLGMVPVDLIIRPRPQSDAPTLTVGQVLVQSDTIKLAIAAICAIRAAVTDLERDASKGCDSLRAHVKQLRSAQKNIASMVSKLLTCKAPTAEESVTRLTNRLRDIKGFEVLAATMKETM